MTTCSLCKGIVRVINDRTLEYQALYTGEDIKRLVLALDRITDPKNVSKAVEIATKALQGFSNTSIKNEYGINNSRALDS